MRFPVFARGANPRVDRAILRKSKTYIETQIALGLADWVNAGDPRQGIICRETVYFGERKSSASVEKSSAGAFRADGELRGVKFIPPVGDSRLAVLASLRAGWDWSIPACN